MTKRKPLFFSSIALPEAYRDYKIAMELNISELCIIQDPSCTELWNVLNFCKCDTKKPVTTGPRNFQNSTVNQKIVSSVHHFVLN